MEWVKTTAKTLPEAIDLALDNLGVDESEAEIVVLEEPRQGLFGRMRGTARVEARVKPKPIRPKTERNRNRRNKAEGKGKGNDRNRRRSGSSGGSGGGQSSGRNRGGGDNRNRDGEGSSSGDRGGRRSGGRDGGGRDGGGRDGGRSGGRNGGGQGQKGRDGNRNDDGRNRSRQGSGGGSEDGGRKSAGRGGKESAARGGGNQTETKPKEETPVEEVAAHLKTFLSDLNEAFGFDGPVSVDSSEDDILVGRIEGRHGLMVGPKGRTLDAIQELARISCQRAVPSSVRIKVDVGGYRQERVEALAAFAAKAADRAAADQSEVALEPMSPADRKAIHDALSEDDRVETRSVGTEPRRKVLVVPVLVNDDDGDDDDVADDDVAGDDENLNGATAGDADVDVEVDVDIDAD